MLEYIKNILYLNKMESISNFKPLNISPSPEKQKNNPLTNEQQEDFSKSQKLYKERLKAVENKAKTKDEMYLSAKSLLSENPQTQYFIKFTWQYYKDNQDIAQKPLLLGNWYLIQNEKWQDDIVYAEKVLRKELEKFVVSYEKEQKTLNDISSLLKNNTDTQTFYELDGKYYLSNPTRIPKINGDTSEILRVKEVSRDELQAKVENLEKWSLEWISKRLDLLISKTNNWNLRNYLMDLRTGISLNGNNDFILTFWERLGNLLNILEKSETRPLSIDEIWKVILYSFNVLRSWISDGTKVVISLIKDISSDKLYKFWDNDSEYEAILRRSIETGKFNEVLQFFNNAWIIPKEYNKSINEASIDTASLPLAIWAGAIDWFLDYTQSSVDIVVTPDTMVQNVVQLSKEIMANWGELYNELVKNFSKISDWVYVLSYIVAVILCFKYYPSKLWALAMPNTIIQWLKASGKIPENMFKWIDTFVSKNLAKIETYTSNKFNKTIISSESVIKWGKKALEWWVKTRDWIDSSNTLFSSIWTNAKQLKASREALAITNNSLKLAQIFGDSIIGRTNEALTTKNAMNAYKETILKGWNDKFDTDDIDSLIEKTKWEARYNLVLVREKLMEVEKVMDKEVLPNWNNYQKFTKKLDMDNMQILKEKLFKNEKDFTNLANIIFRNYIK